MRRESKKYTIKKIQKLAVMEELRNKRNVTRRKQRAK